MVARATGKPVTMPREQRQADDRLRHEPDSPSRGQRRPTGVLRQREPPVTATRRPDGRHAAGNHPCARLKQRWFGNGLKAAALAWRDGIDHIHVMRHIRCVMGRLNRSTSTRSAATTWLLRRMGQGARAYLRPQGIAHGKSRSDQLPWQKLDNGVRSLRSRTYWPASNYRHTRRLHGERRKRLVKGV